MRRILITPALLSALLSLASCSYVLDVDVQPSGDGPQISVREIKRDLFGVQRGCPGTLFVGARGSGMVWRIERQGKCPSTTSFVYGRVPAGWVELVPAAPLESDTTYEVIVFAGGGIGSANFLADGTQIKDYHSLPQP